MNLDYSQIGNSLNDIKDFGKNFDIKNSEHKAIGDDFAKSLFKSMDSDGNGEISKEEFMSATENSQRTDRQLYDVYDKLSGGDGPITADDMQAENLFCDYDSTEEWDLVEVMHEAQTSEADTKNTLTELLDDSSLKGIMDAISTHAHKGAEV